MQHYKTTFPQSYIKSVEAGAKFHQEYKTWSGKGTFQYKDFIKEIISTHKVKTILDFGAGKGIQYSKYNLDKEFNCDVTVYDPCIHGLENWPTGKYDLVMALDCISLIDIHDLPWMYNEFTNWASKAVFITTQIGKNGKQSKQEKYTDIIPIDAEHQLLPNQLVGSLGIKFYIMNNHRFIHQ